MTTKLAYAMKFVASMDAAERVHRDVLGFSVKFRSPHWSEGVGGGRSLG